MVEHSGCAKLPGAVLDMAELEKRRFVRWQGRTSTSAACALMAVSILAGCQGDYPSLSSVPEEARPSLPIETRREIVRDLIAERDASQQQTVTIRNRSGLSTEALPAEDSDISAEDVVPDAPDTADNAFSLTPEDDESLSPIFRRDVDGDNGGLNDFIRQLQRDTSPSAPEPATPSDATPAELDEDELGFFRLDREGATGSLTAGTAIRLAAFAPGLGRQGMMPEAGAIRFVAEGEPGVFCRFFGWSVALFGVCEDDTEAANTPDSDEAVTADLEEEARRLQEEEEADDAASSEDTSSDEPATEDEPEQEPPINRQLVEDAADAIEDAGKGALAPVAGSLEKLRDFIRARRATDQAGSAPDRAPSSREIAGTRQAAAVDRPPVPRHRPERREDITIVDWSEQFDFNRTPRPAFKPTPEQPVILPPATPGTSSQEMSAPPDPPDLSPARPSDLVMGQVATDPPAVADAAEREAQRNVAAALAKLADATREDAAKLQSFEQAAVPPSAALMEKIESLDAASSPDVGQSEKSAPAEAAPSRSATPKPAEPDPLLVMFEPGKPGLPKDAVPELVTMLVDAIARDQKIYIYGEASSNHLARRRATEVGAALVQLGATAEILEYDHRASVGVDQARLVLRPATPVKQATKAEPTAVR